MLICCSTWETTIAKAEIGFIAETEERRKGDGQLHSSLGEMLGHQRAVRAASLRLSVRVPGGPSDSRVAGGHHFPYGESPGPPPWVATRLKNRRDVWCAGTWDVSRVYYTLR